MFLGQQLVEEVLDAQASGCPPEYFNIPVPKGHPEFDPLEKGDRVIPLLRTRYDQRTGLSPNVPREQVSIAWHSVTSHSRAHHSITYKQVYQVIALLWHGIAWHDMA